MARRLVAVFVSVSFVIRGAFASTASPSSITPHTVVANTTPVTHSSCVTENEPLSILAQVFKASAINYDVSIGSLLSLFDRVYGSLSNKALEIYDYVVKVKVAKLEQCRSLIGDTTAVKLLPKVRLANDMNADGYSVSILAEDHAKEYVIVADIPENWDLLGEEDGIRVWKLKNDVPIRSCGYEEKRWSCIKSEAIIDLSPAELRECLMNSAEVPKYNKYSGGRLDVEEISDSTKIVWNRTKVPFAIKPYDFCTLMHVCRHPAQKNSEMIVSKGVAHPLVPIMSDYSRSEIYIGVNILTPVYGTGSGSGSAAATDGYSSPPKHHHQQHHQQHHHSVGNNENKGCSRVRTKLTNISRVRYAGVHPFMASKRSFRGSVDYLVQLRDHASKLQQHNHKNAASYHHHNPHHHHHNQHHNQHHNNQHNNQHNNHHSRDNNNNDKNHC